MAPVPDGGTVFVVRRPVGAKAVQVDGIGPQWAGFRPRFELLGSRCLDGQVPVEATIEVPGADGPRIWRVSLLPDPEQPGMRALGSASDATECRREEDRLRESEIFLQAIVQDQAILLCRFLPDTTLLFVNDAFAATYGTTPEALTGRRFLPLIAEDGRERFMERLADITLDNPVDRHEVHVFTPAGEERWRLWTARGIFDADGKLACYQAVGTEVTAIKKMQAELQESRDLFRMALDATRDGVIDWNLTDDLVWYSPRWKALLGYADDELPNDTGTWTRVLLPEDQPLADRFVREHRAGNRDFESMLRFRHKDGSVRCFQVKATAVPDVGGKPVRMIGACSDITSIMQAQQALLEAKDEAERANRAKSVFLALVSHELRTPLNVIIGFSELIAQESYGPIGDRQYLDYAQDIHDGGRRLLEVINDILDIARLEAGNMEFDLRPVGIDSLLNSEYAAHAAEARAAGVDLSFEAERGLRPVLADRPRLCRAIGNLISNAIKFTPHGGRVRLHARHTDEGGVVFAVSDTGIGMSPEQVPHALEPFSQIDNLLARRRDGMGLGLPATRHIVALHGAALAIETRPDEGTTVSIRFPPERMAPLASGAGSDRLEPPL